jgi:peptidoglycan hydrolase-like protein with peptidoglycan-binding domain
MVPAQPAPPAPAPEVVFEPSAPAVVVTPPPPIAAVPAVAPATAVPAGFDPDGARRVAPRIAAHLRKKGAANYSRQALREFQRLAGLKEDGLYGGRTAGALRYYLGGANPPAPMFRPLQEVSYSPPGS